MENTEIENKTLVIPYIEQSIVDHCNMTCSNCMTYSPILEPYFVDFESFKKDLMRLARFAKINKICFSGGEPLLHPDLAKFGWAIRTFGQKTKVGFKTNGKLLKETPNKIFEAFDYIDVSVFKESDIDYDELKVFLKNKRHELLFKGLAGFKFTFQEISENFINFNSNINLGEESAIEKYSTCKVPYAWNIHTFRDGYFYKCNTVIPKQKYFEKIGKSVEYDFKVEDGINMYEKDFSTEKLANYLYSTTPLKSCFYCQGTETSFEKRVQEIKFYNR